MRIPLVLLVLVALAGCDAVGPDAAGPSPATASPSSYGIQIVQSNPALDSPPASGRVDTDGETYLGSVFLFKSTVSNAGTTYFRLDSPRRTFAVRYNTNVTVRCTTTLFLANGNTVVAESNVSATGFQNVLGPSFAALIPTGLPGASGGRINVERVCRTSNAQTSETALFSAATFLDPVPQP